MDRRTFMTAAGAAIAAPAIRPVAAQTAPTRAETLLLVQEYGPNSLDMQGIGSAQPVNGVALNCYDRLVRFAKVTLPDGTLSYDLTKSEPELAESWQVASDGMSVTFTLRDGATFHSGRPVAAKDVKWSLDRAVSIGGFATTQMNAGSMEKPEQFVAVDDRTFRIDFTCKDKLLMPNLGVTIPFVFDSEAAQKTRTATRGRRSTSRTTSLAEAPSASSPGSPASKLSTRDLTPGRTARSRSCAASSPATS